MVMKRIQVNILHVRHIHFARIHTGSLPQPSNNKPQIDKFFVWLIAVNKGNKYHALPTLNWLGL